ncbi:MULTISPECIES: DoxX family protein [Bacillaceae]|uniref:DoxX family protein n=1 Tax=Evansella alkalicola TaxID=745819 RepID=A0ABS6JS57_9BACI|nr:MULTISPECIES: DoxX family protein [Bacillaceae]MBU9721323.1 DoxX family protein [Bacillus alkalicola]
MYPLLLIRIAVGTVFFFEGIFKWIQPELGVLRFQSIGFPFPEIFALFIGTVEIVFGSLLLINHQVKYAVAPLFCISLGAIITTKIPIFFEFGFIKVFHEGRLDFVLLMATLFLWMKQSKITKKFPLPT